MSEQEHLERVIAHLDSQRAALGDAAVETALAALGKEVFPERAALRPLAGERKRVTVMFADIAGFTALAETMDPEAVRDLVNACFGRLVPIVERYGGVVDKFLGDALMILFGAPQAHEDDSERALRAALEMGPAVAALNAERRTNLAVHVGINTGLVVAGEIGVPGRQQYSVIGDAVNVAARLQDLAGPGEILVGAETFRQTAPLFDFEELAPQAVKGRAQSVTIYRLRGCRAAPGPVRGIAGLESPLVGRETEYRELQAAVERLAAGEGGVVTVVGEAGLGKSRLVAEVRARLAGAGPRWVEGRCLSYSAAVAYQLWLDALRALLGVTPEDEPLAVQAVLQERVRAYGAERFAGLYPYLGRLLALPLSEEDAAMLREQEGEQLRVGTFQSVTRLIEAAAREQPLVLVCEDLHWADPTSLALLEQLLALTDTVPLLVVCLFRPEREHGCWRIRELVADRYRHRHTDLWLAPLTADESKTLVNNLLPIAGLPAQLGPRVLAAAEGNPFYVEEIIRSLIDSGVIVRDAAAGRWQVRREVEEIAIPDTLQGVLVARLDRLGEGPRRALQLAAVIGRIFSCRVLAAIASEVGRLDECLQRLLHEDLIRERTRSPEPEYIFKHHLIQEAAYNSLLIQERQVFHRRIAEALERFFPTRIGEQLGLLAYHWEQAAEPEQAVHYLLQAGDQARLLYAHAEAVDYYRRALPFLQGPEQAERAARTLIKMGQTYHNALDLGRARESFAAGFALWQRAGALATDLPPAPHALRTSWVEPHTLDPAFSADAFTDLVLEQLYRGLVTWSPELDILPDIARRWEVSEDGRHYLFNLRQDASWSDGTPVTAMDLEYAWNRLLDPRTASPLAALLYSLRGGRARHQGASGDSSALGVRALDPHTLAVELEEPTAYFLQLLAHSATYPVPRHLLAPRDGHFTEQDCWVASGPFRIRSWQPGRAMVLERNLHYHGQFRGNVERIELSFGLDWREALARYAADELDVLSLRGMAPVELDRARRRYAGEYVPVPRLLTFYAGLTVTHPPLDDSRVRRALAMAIDRELLADVVLRGHDVPATGGFLPVGMPGHSPGIALPYDPVQARRLLADAGYPEGRGFPPLSGLSLHTHRVQGDFLREQWQKNLGIVVVWDHTDFDTLQERLNKQPPDVHIIGWLADYPDPDSFLRASPVQSWTRWNYPPFAGLVEEATHMPDQERRLALYREADRILVGEAAILPLTYWRTHLLVKPWIHSYRTSAIRHWYWSDVVIHPHESPLPQSRYG